jgi:hypothetical protein
VTESLPEPRYAKNKIVIISCGKKKLTRPAAAGELYIGSYFIMLLHYALTIAPTKNLLIQQLWTCVEGHLAGKGGIFQQMSWLKKLLMNALEPLELSQFKKEFTWSTGNQCLFCGKKLHPTKMKTVALDHGNAFIMPANAREEEIGGAFEIGLNCAKKLPPGYVF